MAALRAGIISSENVINLESRNVIPQNSYYKSRYSFSLTYPFNRCKPLVREQIATARYQGVHDQLVLEEFTTTRCVRHYKVCLHYCRVSFDPVQTKPENQIK